MELNESYGLKIGRFLLKMTNNLLKSTVFAKNDPDFSF